MVLIGVSCGVWYGDVLIDEVLSDVVKCLACSMMYYYGLSLMFILI